MRARPSRAVARYQVSAESAMRSNCSRPGSPCRQLASGLGPAEARTALAGGGQVPGVGRERHAVELLAPRELEPPEPAALAGVPVRDERGGLRDRQRAAAAGERELRRRGLEERAQVAGHTADRAVRVARVGAGAGY